MNVTVKHHVDKHEFNPVVSTRFAGSPFRKEVVMLRIYTYQGLSLAQHMAIEAAACKLHEELPIQPLDTAPKLKSVNRHGIFWEVRATIDPSRLPKPTHDPKDCCTDQLAFAVAAKEQGWKERTV